MSGKELGQMPCCAVREMGNIGITLREEFEARFFAARIAGSDELSTLCAPTNRQPMVDAATADADALLDRLAREDHP